MTISLTIGRFRFDRAIIGLLLLGAALLGGRVWLEENPQHDPWAPLSLYDPPGWATQRKLAALRLDPVGCRAVLERSGVTFRVLDPAGKGECRREDRIVLSNAPLSPRQPVTTCGVGAGLELWLRQSVRPAAVTILGSPVERIEHFGTYSCRRIYGGDSGNWSEHATGNAIDIAAFVLEDGRRISVVADWAGGAKRRRSSIRCVMPPAECSPRCCPPITTPRMPTTSTSIRRPGVSAASAARPGFDGQG